MTTNPHKTAALGQRHGAVNWTFATTTLRRDVGPYVLTDLGSECMQTDTSPPTFWKLVAIASPGPTATPTWRQIPTTADVIVSPVGAILGSEPAIWYDGALSTFTDVGGGVISMVTDASGHGFDGTFGSGARPLLVPGGFGSFRSFRFTSSQYGGNAACPNPTPGTQGMYFFAVFKAVTFIANTPVIALGTAGQASLYQESSTSVRCYNGSSGAVSPVLSAGTWACFEGYLSNNASDYSALNGTAGTNGSAGNAAIANGFYLNADAAGGSPGNHEYVTVFKWPGAPSSGQRTALRALWGF